MKADFSRVLTLLRKEKGISQKQAANELQISQALLSHYEKGIRECGLDFVVKTADFYEVSCDFLLGRSLDRNGVTINVDEIPDEDDAVQDNKFKGSVLPTLNKKLIVNSLNIIFDLLQKSKNKALVKEVSLFFMMSVYRVFRIIFSANAKNQQNFFVIPKTLANAKANAVMSVSEANATAIASAEQGTEKIENIEELHITSENLSSGYPKFSSSFMNLIQTCEGHLKKH